MGFTKDFGIQKINSDDVLKDYLDFAKAVDEGDVLALTSFDDAQISHIPEETKKPELQNYSKNCQKCKKTLKKKLRMHELPPDLQNEQRCKNRVAARRCRQLKRSRLESLEKDVEELTKEYLKLEKDVASLRDVKSKLVDQLYNHECVMYERRIVFYD